MALVATWELPDLANWLVFVLNGQAGTPAFHPLLALTGTIKVLDFCRASPS